MIENARKINDPIIRRVTLDGLTNPRTCIAHRAGLTEQKKTQILKELLRQGLLKEDAGASLNGGLLAGIFPPVLEEATTCPQLPLPFTATPGSEFGGHHSYPGGLAVHEAFNDQNSISLAATYRAAYGGGQTTPPGFIDQDLILAAPMWHDWAKMLVFQWTTDGAEFTEMTFGGNGSTDKFGAPGNSRTGAHHIISLAESMARGLPPALVITQACAHSAPTLGNEYKVVNWIRAAAILAQRDPITAGYLTRGSNEELRLPALRQLAGLDLVSNGQTNLLIEYQIHNLSDADFTNAIPAVTQAESLLTRVAPRFGYDPSDAPRYRTRFRNVVLAQLSAERIEMLSAASGIEAVIGEIEILRKKNLL